MRTGALNRSSRGGRAGSITRFVLAVALVSALGAAAAQSALAAGTPFARGDVLTSGLNGIIRFAPDGTQENTISPPAPGGGAAQLCFDRNGNHLVAPGLGLFDSSGNLLPSNWASVAPPIGECTVDGFGHVYLAGGPSGGDVAQGDASGTIRKFDLTGNLLSSYTVVTADSSGGGFSTYTFNLDIAPDQCTMYYASDGGDIIRKFNVCTNTQEPYTGGFASRPTDQIRVRPNGQVLAVSEEGVGWDLFDPSGQLVGQAAPGSFGSPNERALALDPDGTSVWIGGGGQPDCCAPGASPVQNVARFDIAGGRLLTRWRADDQGFEDGLLPWLSVFAPPLLGSADIGSRVDRDAAGTAEAFFAPARFSGPMKSLDIYLDAASTATRVKLGIYTDRWGHPGTLLDEATIAGPAPGSWNHVRVPSLSVKAGERLWIAVLAPRGAGTIRFRDAPDFGPRAQLSREHELTTLPFRWSTGFAGPRGRVSADGS